MTEARAWRKVAEQIDAARGERWLCNEAIRFGDLGIRMVARVETYLERDCSTAYGYDSKWHQDNNQGRVLAALWLALDAENEAK